MKRNATVRIVIYSIIALVLTGIMVAGMLAGSVIQWMVRDGVLDSILDGTLSISNYDESAYTVGQGAIAVEPVERIEIYWISGSVEVVRYDGEQLLFEETASTELTEQQKLRYTVSDNQLTIQFCSPSVSGWRNSYNKKLVVQVPNDLTQLSVSDLGSQTSVSDLNCQSLAVESVSGSVTLRDVTGTSLQLEQVSGRTEIDAAFDTIDVSSVSGGIDLRLSRMPSRIDIEQVSGSNNLYLPPENDGFTVRHDTLSGGVTCDFDARYDSKQIVYGNGSAQINFESVSGGLRISQNTAA